MCSIMITNHSRNLLFTAILGAYLLSATGIWAQETETRIGPLEFDHGLPTQDTVRKLYDEMDFQRACQAAGAGTEMVVVGWVQPCTVQMDY